MKKLLFLVCAFTVIVVQAQSILDPEVLWRFSRVSDPKLSPDGTTAVYSIRNVDWKASKGNTDLWLVDVASGKSRILTGDSSNESSPRWSADGKLIYFLNDAGGTSQLWSIATDGSAKKQLSKLTDDINAYGISANGKSIWMAMDVKVGKFNGKDIYGDLPKTSGRIYDDLMMRHWDTWDNGTYSHVFVAALSADGVGEPKDIMANEPYDCPMKPNGGDDEICWNPEGTIAAYTCKKSIGREYAVGTNSDIYLYTVATGATKNITDGMNGYDKSPLFSPDGKKLVWASQAEAGNEADRARLYYMEVMSGNIRDLSVGFDQNFENAAWSNDSQRLYFISSTNGTQQVYVYDFRLKSALPIRQITKDVANHFEITVSFNPKSNRDLIMTNRMSMSAPPELYLIDGESGKSSALTATNSALLSGIKMGEVQQRMIRATDGKEILTWVILPPDFDPNKKYPTLLYCQGGPQSMVGQSWSYRWNFQLMAAKGYIVVAPNRRGLPGFGSEWNDAISGDWGGQAMKDLLSAIDSVAREPYVDKDRLGAVGASFGGFSVFWLAGNHNKRFKAFISHNGVYNMESMLATEEIFFYQHENQGFPWDLPKPKAYTQFSPSNYVGKWDTPILIIANEKDYRVPYNQGLEAFTAARLRNVPSQLLTFPDENHWVLKPQNSVLWQRVFYNWLDKYLK